MSDYNTNTNVKPTVGEKLKAAFSSKTAEEIHAENLAKKQEYMDNNNTSGTTDTTNTNSSTISSNTSSGYSGSGSGMHGAGMNATSGSMSSGYSGSGYSNAGGLDKHGATTYANDPNNNYTSGSTTTSGSGSDSMMGQPSSSSSSYYQNQGHAGGIGDNLGLRASNQLSHLAGNKEYPHSSSTTSTNTTSGDTHHTIPVVHQDTSDRHKWTGTGHPTATNTTTTSGPSSSSSLGGGARGVGQRQGPTVTESNLTVNSVAKDAFRQIESQEREALAKAEELKRQDEAILMQSSSGAFSNLDSQAEMLKAKVEKEKLAAESAIAAQQSAKITRTGERAATEKAAIHQAAVQRRAELEAKSNKLQAEIDELARLKTQEMLAEKPGDLQFQHVREEPSVIAKLTGAVAHKLGVSENRTITDSITAGHVEHQPSQVTKTYMEGAPESQTHTQQYSTQQGQYHELPTKSTTSTHPNTLDSTTEQRQALADSKRNI